LFSNRYNPEYFLPKLAVDEFVDREFQLNYKLSQQAGDPCGVRNAL
jgi:hypothetical protein